MRLFGPRTLIVPAALFTTLLLPLLAGCDFSPDAPDKAAVAQTADPGCTVVEVHDMETLPEIQAGFRRVAYPYEADCAPKGSGTAQRLRARVVYEEHQNWWHRYWVGTSEYLPAQAANAAQAPKAAGVSGRESGQGLESPADCQSQIKQFADEVLPCLETKTPGLAEPLHAQVDSFNQELATLHAHASNPAVTEAELNAHCLDRLHEIDRQITAAHIGNVCGLHP